MTLTGIVAVTLMGHCNTRPDYRCANFISLNLTAMQDLEETAQMLFLRLFLRSGPWFKLNTLDYSECSDAVATMECLCKAGLAVQLQAVEKLDRGSIVKAMTIVEIQSLLASLDLQPKKTGSKPPSKAQLVQLLSNALQSPSEVRVLPSPTDNEDNLSGKNLKGLENLGKAYVNKFVVSSIFNKFSNWTASVCVPQDMSIVSMCCLNFRGLTKK